MAPPKGGPSTAQSVTTTFEHKTGSFGSRAMGAVALVLFLCSWVLSFAVPIAMVACVWLARWVWLAVLVVVCALAYLPVLGQWPWLKAYWNGNVVRTRAHPFFLCPPAPGGARRLDATHSPTKWARVL